MSLKAHSIIIPALALLSLGGQALAADLPSRKAAPIVPPPPAFTWTGLYLGFSTAYTWTASPTIDARSANVLDSSGIGWGPYSAQGAGGAPGARLDGFLFGGQLGYNWQFADRFVAGFETDIQGAGVRGGGGLQNLLAPPGGFVVTSATFRRSLEYLGTARGRLGYAVTPNLLVYATGGLAYGGVDLSASVAQSLVPSLLIGNTAKGDAFENRVGWAAGAGVEWAFARNLSARLEYLYYDLGALALSNARMDPLAYTRLLSGDLRLANATNVSARYNGHMLRAGLNYRFDWSTPQTSGSGATPFFASLRPAQSAPPAFGDWRVSAMLYEWALGLNGTLTVRDQSVDADATFVDAVTKSSSFPLAFMGRIEAQNGPVSFYGDLAWMQIRFSGSTLRLNSPLAGLALTANASGRMKMTMAIGEAGAGYEFTRFSLTGDPDRFIAVDAYGGLRYWYLNVDLSLQALAAADFALLDLSQSGARTVAKSGGLEWIDPVVGLRARHELAPGERLEMRGDIGGFGVGSKFSWEFYGGYSREFSVNGLNLVGTAGYRALGVDYSRLRNNRTDGINAVLHGPVVGLSLRF